MLSSKSAGSVRLQVKLFLIVVIVLHAAAYVEAADVTGPGVRVIHFPAGRSLGKLKLYAGPTSLDDLTGGDHEWGNWEFFHEARGDVTIPAGKIVQLELILPGNVRDLSPLKKLGPNDLYAVALDDVPGRFPQNSDETVLPYLSGLTGLKELSIGYAKISGSGLRHLGQLNVLKKLTIFGNDKPLDAGLPYLANLKSLEYLYLDCPCTDAGIQGLAGLTSVKRLLLSINGIKGPGLVHLQKMPALRFLTLYGGTFSDEGLAYIRNLTSLTHLHLFCFQGEWSVTDAGLAHLSSLTRLEELEFTHLPGITDAGLVHLKPLRSLKKLKLEWSKITDVGLAQLGEIKLLESLRLPGGITDTGLAYLAKELKLKELRVSGKQITDEGVKHLATIRSLEYLDLFDTSVTDAGMDSIAQLTNLQNLGLHCYPGRRMRNGVHLLPEAGQPGVPLTDAGLAKLAPLKSLKSLYVRNAKITISGLSHLNALSNLTFLRIGEIQQDDTGMDISGLTKLEELIIDPAKDSPLRDEDMACLAQLKNLRNLQFVWPNKNGIGDQGLKHLAGLTNLDTLVVGSNLTDEGLGHLKNMSKLYRLTIFGDFTDQGLRHLEGLKGLSILKIDSKRPFGITALKRLRQKLPYLYSFSFEESNKSGK